MADTDLIERAAKAIDLFDAICNIHDPSVSAHDRRVRAMAKVLEAAPSPSPAPGVVTEEMVETAARAYAEHQHGKGCPVWEEELPPIRAALASLSQPAKGAEGGE